MNRKDETLAFEADREWIDANLNVLRNQYADHWIAVKDGNVIACAADLGALLSQVPDLAHTCIEFVSEQVQVEI
jgi:hypothetical protein